MKSELNSLFREKAEFLIQKSREHHYFNGSRPSHQLALRLRSNERRACISAIQSSDGNIVTTPTEINATLVCFYKNLYKSDMIFNKERFENFLTNINIRKLSETEAVNLGENISLEELWDSVQEMKLGKSPGPDGIPIEIYSTFWSELGPMLLEMMNTSIRRGYFLRQTNTALISLLLKKHKDPMFCYLSSYILN